MITFIIAVIDWAVSVSLVCVSVKFDIAPTRQVCQKKVDTEARMEAGGIFL